MKKVYEKPIVNFEEYSLNTQIAGACADAGKETAVNHAPVELSRQSVHCIMYPSGASKNCSEGAHTHTIGIDATIFADSGDVCTRDVYSISDYNELLGEILADVKVTDCGEYMSFNGRSAEHTGSITTIDYTNLFRS